MADPLFAASRIKLERAKKFIDEFRAEESRYRADDPLSAKARTFLYGHITFELSWKGVGLLPGAIFGDAIHNLRASLDLMASELARLNGKSDKDVYFPFAHSQDNLAEAIKKKSFAKA